MGRALDRCRPKAQGTWLGRGLRLGLGEIHPRVWQLQRVLAGDQPLFLEPFRSSHSFNRQAEYQTASHAFIDLRWMRGSFRFAKITGMIRHAVTPEPFWDATCRQAGRGPAAGVGACPTWEPGNRRGPRRFSAQGFSGEAGSEANLPAFTSATEM